MIRTYLITASLAGIISVPFLLEPEAESDPRRASSPQQILNIITPHSESIRREFTDAFREHIRRQEGREIFIEWRVPGGTSEIEKILQTEYGFAFEHYWRHTLARPWSSELASSYQDRTISLPARASDDSPSQAARRAFLASEIGVGFDLFFGGGAYPFIVNSGKGYLVDSGIRQVHPEWFVEDIIPSAVGGEPFYDPDFRWIGTCLTTFGICINEDVVRRLDLQESPIDWNLLGHTELYREIAVANPSTSGSVVKAFEMILQQQMRLALDTMRAEVEAEGTRFDSQHQAFALSHGWANGLRLVRRISANTRYFANFAAKIPADVAAGNAAAGMCIDYYGRTFHEQLQRDDRPSRVRFVTPPGGSSMSVDPIGLLRGAPNRPLALKFIAFVLSPEGQKLWNYRAGTPGGPRKQSLRRLPVRRDLYQAQHLQHFADPDELPYEKSDLFHYEAAWTARAFGAIRFIIKSMCVDTHAELQAAWRALVQTNFPPQALTLFNNVERVSYDVAMGEVSEILKRPKIEQSRYARDLNALFRQQYARVIDLTEDPGPR